MPRLEPIFQRFQSQGFAIVAVERTRNRDAAQKLIADNKLSYHFLEDGEGDREVVRSVFGVRSFPTSYLVDRRGRIIFKHLGFEEGNEAEIAAEVEKLLAMEPPGAPVTAQVAERRTTGSPAPSGSPAGCARV